MNRTIQNTRRAGEGESVRTLIIDADPSIVRFLQMYLDDQGFSIYPAFTSEEGLSLAETLLPDLILLDNQMPGIDSAEVLRLLKHGAETRRIPVVVLTARSDVGEKLKSLGLGAHDYVAKPFDIRELRARLLSVFSRKRDNDESTEAARLETLREVVASVSHEVNNPLAAILMSAEALERREGENAYVLEKSRVIQENALRIRNILQRLERVRKLASKVYVARDRILDLDAEEGL